MKPYIPVVLGTSREGRYSERIAQFVLSIAQTFDIETELVDVKDFDTSHTISSWVENEKTKQWKEIAGRAAGFIIVSPEYNHSFPGELKVLIDMGLKEYEGKPVATVGVSSGKIGGARMIEHLLQIYVYLQMRPVMPSVNVSMVQDLLDKQPAGELEKQYGEYVRKTISKLLTFCP